MQLAGFWSILVVLANAECAESPEGERRVSSSSARQELDAVVLADAEPVNAATLTDGDAEGRVNIVRTDTYPECGDIIAVKLETALGSFKGVNKAARRLQQFDEIIEDSGRRFKHVEFSTKPKQPSLTKGVCQLITEVDAPRSGEAPDGKPEVDAWDSCHVQQSLHTINGSLYFYKTWEKKVHCKVLLAIGEMEAIRRAKGEFELFTELDEKVFQTIPCSIIKTKPFNFEASPGVASIAGGVAGAVLGVGIVASTAVAVAPVIATAGVVGTLYAASSVVAAVVTTAGGAAAGTGVSKLINRFAT